MRKSLLDWFGFDYWRKVDNFKPDANFVPGHSRKLSGREPIWTEYYKNLTLNIKVKIYGIIYNEEKKK